MCFDDLLDEGCWLTEAGQYFEFVAATVHNASLDDHVIYTQGYKAQKASACFDDLPSWGRRMPACE